MTSTLSVTVAVLHDISYITHSSSDGSSVRAILSLYNTVARPLDDNTAGLVSLLFIFFG